MPKSDSTFHNAELRKNPNFIGNTGHLMFECYGRTMQKKSGMLQLFYATKLTYNNNDPYSSKNQKIRENLKKEIDVLRERAFHNALVLMNNQIHSLDRLRKKELKSYLSRKREDIRPENWSIEDIKTYLRRALLSFAAFTKKHMLYTFVCEKELYGFVGTDLAKKIGCVTAPKFDLEAVGYNIDPRTAFRHGRIVIDFKFTQQLDLFFTGLNGEKLSDNQLYKASSEGVKIALPMRNKLYRYVLAMRHSGHIKGFLPRENIKNSQVPQLKVKDEAIRLAAYLGFSRPEKSRHKKIYHELPSVFGILDATTAALKSYVSRETFEGRFKQCLRNEANKLSKLSSFVKAFVDKPVVHRRSQIVALNSSGFVPDEILFEEFHGGNENANMQKMMEEFADLAKGKSRPPSLYFELKLIEEQLNLAVSEKYLSSINISPWLFDQPELVELMQKMMTKHNLVNQVIEITEYASLSAASMSNVIKLNKMGYCIALDDVGSGAFTSLAYLKNMKALGAVKIIKFDGAFIKKLLGEGEKSQSFLEIVRTLFGEDVTYIAEGVSKKMAVESFQTLYDLGVDAVQLQLK